MNDPDLIAMFMLGILGTGHCLGMCGPLVFAFPGQTGKFTSHLWYHLGRGATYVVMGVVMGGIGVGLAGLVRAGGGDYPVWIARIQIWFSLVAALFLMLFGLTRLGIITEPRWLIAASPGRLPGFKRIMRTPAPERGRLHMLLLGMMMGFLPCGLSFAAFARALAAGGPLSGGLLVLAFALGTLPGLLLLGTGISELVKRYRTHSDIIAGLLMIYMAIHLFAKAF
jgi:sulfite exporter TauE/SafE